MRQLSNHYSEDVSILKQVIHQDFGVPEIGDNIYGVGGTVADLGLLFEYMRDSRLDLAPDPLHHDVFFGARLGLNDEADTQALLGVVQDIDDSTRQYFFEASQRIFDGVKATLELQVFSSVAANDALRGLKDDDFVRIEVAYYY